MSSLSARYNGFMLGHFLAMASFPSLYPPRYSLLRGRVNAFLAEVGVSERLPLYSDSFQEDPFSRILAVFEALRSRSSECASTAWLSAAVIFRARGVRSFRDADLLAAAHALKIDPHRVRRYERTVPRTPRVTISELLDPAMYFLHMLITSLRSERRTCFVAMPFRSPFEHYYPTFYRPALGEMGYRAIRAWGGVGMENYLEVVLALIERSGACLADVTGRNSNVLYELGAAQGMDKKVLILSAEPVDRLPANVSQHTAFRFHYDPRARNWPSTEVIRFVAQISLAEFSLMQSGSHEK